LWWNHFRASSLSTILSITLPTVVSGLYAVVKLQSRTREWNLYAAGTAFAIGHFAFAPPIVNAVNHIGDEKGEHSNGNVEWLKHWLRIHMWRTLLTDTPAAVCFGILVFGR
jgi:hypothetical protein